MAKSDRETGALESASADKDAPDQAFTEPKADEVIIGYRKVEPVGYELVRNVGIVMPGNVHRLWVAGFQSSDKDELEMLARNGAVLKPIWP
ncbi:MAG TPA: hypothetical protein PK677_11390 [Acidiphilium sp.]|nr:hypothetical protein [Acidiphilium sp.]